jgi:hypothetical protein
MPAQVLVMCSQCARPQFATQATCVSCGAVLPEAPVAKEELKSARERLLEAHQPFLEATLGRGQRLTLSEKKLEWHPGVGNAQAFPLEELKGARLHRRPVFEALILGALAVALGALVPWLWARIVLGLFFALSLTACFAQRRFFIELTGEKGVARLPLAIGRVGAPIGQRVMSIWQSLKDELERRGVRCAG